MSKSKLFLLIWAVMMVVMIAFLTFALSHPEKSFPGGNSVAYAVYVVYVSITIIMLVLSKKMK